MYDIQSAYYIIAILLEGGIIVGIEQNVSYNAALGLVLFKMSPKVGRKSLVNYQTYTN